MFKPLVSLVTAATIALTLTGCASVTTGTSQNVLIKSSPVQGATCTLQNSKGKWYLDSTPASVTVARSYSDLAVTCKKSGYPVGSAVVKSHTKPMILGNALIGGFIGAGVDMASGAAYGYPEQINVPLRK